MNLSQAKKILPLAVYNELLRKLHRSKNTGGSSDMEYSPCDEPLAEKKSSRFTTPVCIGVYSYRRRLADTDGISAKAAIDGLVHCGILPSDTAEVVKEITYAQKKISGEEYTEIIISNKRGTDGTRLRSYRC